MSLDEIRNYVSQRYISNPLRLPLRSNSDVMFISSKYTLHAILVPPCYNLCVILTVKTVFSNRSFTPNPLFGNVGWGPNPSVHCPFLSPSVEYNRLEFLLQPFETVTDGFETIPRAFVDMMDGASQGKVIVRVWIKFMNKNQTHLFRIFVVLLTICFNYKSCNLWNWK